ncbi:dihydroorotate dehydrogenase-like protein, partial [Candidatus Poribacteria bacterium]|nr:dihydroorotate dehydrogenase-like protein [Candidatus Poribacteria bacterium]
MMDLSATYMGLKLNNPLVVSSSPLCKEIDNIRKMEEAGASAVVLHSLFKEQITLEMKDLNYFLNQGTESYAESLSYFPDIEDLGVGPDGYLDHIRKAKEAVDIPIIGSLNGVSTGGWIEYAKLMEEAGADALELNIYYIPTDLNMSGSKIEEMYVEVLTSVKSNISIPVAAKLSPYFSSLPNMVKQLKEAGANALSMFNRFYQPDLDLNKLEVNPNLTLSTSEELRLRLRWVAILYSRIDIDMAVTGGVHTAEDAIKCVMAGANVAMMTSALLKNGIDHLTKIKDGMVKWMESREYESVKQMQGVLSQKSVAEPAAFERANYMKV